MGATLAAWTARCARAPARQRARAVLDELGYDPSHCYAYGDTASDIPFLGLFGYPRVVDPDPGLAVEARKRGGPMLNGQVG